MIKASSIRKLTDQIVIKKLMTHLEPHGFKYLKSKKNIKRTVGDFDHNISVHTLSSPLEFNSETDELSLKFNIRASVESPKFDKWLADKLKIQTRHNELLQIANCVESIEFDALNEGDFFTPNESQKFKHVVSAALAGSDDLHMQLSDFINRLPEWLRSFDSYPSTHLKSDDRANLKLLVFQDKLELAKDLYLQRHSEMKSRISENLETDRNTAKEQIRYFDFFVSEAQILLDLNLDNSFERSLVGVPIKHQRVKLADQLGFEERARFDTSLISIRSFDINNDGECLILREDGVATRIDKSGSSKKLAKINFGPDQFRNAKVKWLRSANRFICGNYILSDTDQWIELSCDTEDDQKQSSLQIRELLFASHDKTFHLIYSWERDDFHHSIFDLSGKLLSTQTISEKFAKLNLARKEYIVRGEGNAFDVVSFDGVAKGTFKYKNGNDHIALSPMGDKMVLHFYSTSSKVHDLETNKNHVLWAHSTHIKGYKETFYNDIHHNFGMTYCTFAPDGKHIIGGAEHGKYVVWDTQKYQRKELFPSDKSQSIFDWSKTIYTSEGKTEKRFTPYGAKLGGQEHFVNRGYNISKVSFLDDGKYSISQVGDSLLVWDSKFQNVGHVNGIGRAVFSEANYLAINPDNEFVIFERVKAFSDNFESSLFKPVVVHEAESIPIESSQAVNRDEADDPLSLETMPTDTKSIDVESSLSKLIGKLFLRR